MSDKSLSFYRPHFTTNTLQPTYGSVLDMFSLMPSHQAKAANSSHTDRCSMVSLVAAEREIDDSPSPP